METLLSAHNENVNKCVHWLRETLGGNPPKVAIITGSSGPHALLDYFDKGAKRDYLPTPFRTPVVSGHLGEYCHGKMNGVSVILILGRVHYNERTNDPYYAVTNVRALALWGVKTFIITNASGSLTHDRPVGSINIVDDHISSYAGASPLVGDPDIVARFGSRFIDCSDVYDYELVRLATSVGDHTLTKKQIHGGAVFLMTPGPNFETPAEIKKYARDGAHLVGMSTVPEALALHQMGRKVLALSLVTNMCRYFRRKPNETSLEHEMNLAIAQGMDEPFAKYIAEIVKAIGAKTQSAKARIEYIDGEGEG